ncbi:unnamed protein product [Parajaminaea phylloscopi]
MLAQDKWSIALRITPEIHVQLHFQWPDPSFPACVCERGRKRRGGEAQWRSAGSTAAVQQQLRRSRVKRLSLKASSAGAPKSQKNKSAG